MKSPRTSMLRETARRMRCLHRRFPGFQGGITLRLRNSPPADGLRGVSEIMRLAARETIPVTPRGDGRGLAGAAVPTHGGISLSLERMIRILEIDGVDRVAVVEPGVVTNDLLNLMIGALMRGIKQLFDPHGILNPGTIL